MKKNPYENDPFVKKTDEEDPLAGPLSKGNEDAFGQPSNDELAGELSKKALQKQKEQETPGFEKKKTFREKVASFLSRKKKDKDPESPENW